MKNIIKLNALAGLTLSLLLSGCSMTTITQEQADQSHAKASDNRTKAAKAKAEGKDDLAAAFEKAADLEDSVKAGTTQEGFLSNDDNEDLLNDIKEAQDAADKLEAKYAAADAAAKANAQAAQNNVAAPAAANDAQNNQALAGGNQAAAQAEGHVAQAVALAIAPAVAHSVTLSTSAPPVMTAAGLGVLNTP